MTIMGIDWGLQEAEIKESTNRRRLLTGFCGGLGLYSLYFFLARQFVGFIKLTNIKQKDLF